jgi:hypothetical protein
VAEVDGSKVVLEAIKHSSEVQEKSFDRLTDAILEVTKEVRHSTKMGGDTGQVHQSPYASLPIVLVIIAGLGSVGMALLSGEQRVADIRSEFQNEKDTSLDNKLHTEVLATRTFFAGRFEEAEKGSQIRHNDQSSALIAQERRLTELERGMMVHEREVSRFNATQTNDIAWIKLKLEKP